MGSKDDDDVPIVVNISPSKATRGSPSVKVIPNGSSSSPSCVPQRRAAASAEKSFISSPMKPGEKKEAEKKKREAENKKSKGKKESSDDEKDFTMAEIRRTCTLLQRNGPRLLSSPLWG